MPNIDEIHLEPINRCTIYHDYRDEMEKNGTDALSITKFLLLWRECYPKVKIREYKAVTGSLLFIFSCVAQIFSLTYTPFREMRYMREM